MRLTSKTFYIGVKGLNYDPPSFGSIDVIENMLGTDSSSMFFSLSEKALL